MTSKVLIVLIFAVVCKAGPVEEPAQPADTVVPAVDSAQEASVPVVSTIQAEIQPNNEAKRVEGIRSSRSYTENEVPMSGNINKFEDGLLGKLNSKCAQRDGSSCAMLKLITYINRMLKKSNIEVSDNIEITQTSSTVQIQAGDLPRQLNNEPEEIQLAELMTGKLLSFVKSRSLRLHMLPTVDVVVTSNPDSDGNLNLGMKMENVQEGRGKKKDMGGLMAAIVMKAGMLGALAFKGLALLVGKALLVSKIALLLAVVIGLKKLLSQPKLVTYEVVAQPHHSHSHVEHVEHGHGGGSGGGSGGGHDSYSSGWGRSLNINPAGKGDGQDIAYKAYAPKA